jgi:hypothetical protein
VRMHFQCCAFPKITLAADMVESKNTIYRTELQCAQ